MARRVILDTQYTFTPSTQTITIPRIIKRERLLLITNVTSNKVIYNFSDPTLTATSYTFVQGTNYVNPQTVVVLNYNTTAMNATDNLSIVIDEAAEFFMPDETLVDPVGKLRVSQPQSLIDTDFEYSTQPTKWETLITTNMRASFYYLPALPLTVSNVLVSSLSANVTVNTFPTAPPAVGSPIYVQDTTWYGANGNYLVETANTAATGTFTFTYTGRYSYLGQGTNQSVYDSSLTNLYSGSFYSNANLSVTSVTSGGTNGQVVYLSTVDPHGLQVGDGVIIANVTATSNTPASSFQVAAVTSNVAFQVIANAAPSGTISNFTGNVYIRPDGLVAHRAYDGGVQFTTGNPGHNIQLIRQTRRYFRYQSGKGIQISTGTILKSGVFVDDLSYNTITGVITVTTKFPHYMAPGVSISISGANETAYNGNFIIQQVLNAVQFTYIPLSVPVASTTYTTSTSGIGSVAAATPASGFPILLQPNSWYGSTNRVGIFDTQNGIFFEYDGQTLWCVRRRSTDQISGTWNVVLGSAQVTAGTINGFSQNKASKQLTAGDFVVIRGMNYRIADIISDTQFTLTSPYRGVTPNGAVIISKVIEVRVPQSAWNMDKADGTGPSGFNIDLTKMQMWYLDYSWYGAGQVRFGFRDTIGKIIYVHRFVNNNQNPSAWMRSGNLPARYETNTFAPRAVLTANMTATSTTLTVSNVQQYGFGINSFPPTGTLLIADPVNGYEYVYYSNVNVSTNTFNLTTRGQPSTYITAITTTNTSANITTTSSVSSIQPGMQVYSGAPGLIGPNTSVYAIYPGASVNTITLNQAPIGNITGTGNLVFNQMGNVASNHFANVGQPITVYSHAPQFCPVISHWGTSVVMDGLFNDDKSLQFVNGEPGQTTVGPGVTVALQSIRVSPSVDSGITGTLGQKEIVNRMQLVPQAAEVLVNGSFLIQIVLNGQLSANTGSLSQFSRVAVGTSSLAQVADHSGNVAISGGETIYGFYAVNTAGSGNYSTVPQDLSKIRDLGNSIHGGSPFNDPTKGFYPDGPDVITIVATNIGTTYANIQSRFSWTEAQA